MQKIGHRLRNILLLAILILVAGTAASIAEDQLSPEGPRVIGQLFGMEAQAAEEYLNYDLADYAGQDLSITITKPEQYVRLTQSNNETPVNVNITINWNTYYSTSVQAAARVYIDSLNMGSGSIKIVKGSSFGGGNPNLKKEVGIYIKGDNVIKSTTDEYVISSDIDDVRIRFQKECLPAMYTKEGVRLINTKNPDKTLRIKGGTNIKTYTTIVGLSGLEKEEAVRMYDSDKPCCMFQCQLPTADMPKEIIGYGNVPTSLPTISSGGDAYLGEDGKITILLSADDWMNRLTSGTQLTLKFGKNADFKYEGADAGVIHRTSEGYAVPRLNVDMK